MVHPPHVAGSWFLATFQLPSGITNVLQVDLLSGSQGGTWHRVGTGSPKKGGGAFCYYKPTIATYVRATRPPEAWPLANNGAMPLAHGTLEVLQVRKLTQCVRTADNVQIAKLVEHGIPGLINYQGERSLLTFMSVRFRGDSVLCCARITTL